MYATESARESVKNGREFVRTNVLNTGNRSCRVRTMQENHTARTQDIPSSSKFLFLSFTHRQTNTCTVFSSVLLHFGSFGFRLIVSHRIVFQISTVGCEHRKTLAPLPFYRLVINTNRMAHVVFSSVRREAYHFNVLWKIDFDQTTHILPQNKVYGPNIATTFRICSKMKLLKWYNRSVYRPTTTNIPQ